MNKPIRAAAILLLITMAISVSVVAMFRPEPADAQAYYCWNHGPFGAYQTCVFVDIGPPYFW